MSEGYEISGDEIRSYADAKDPLEELRDCVRYGNTPGENVLAAWEKERAEIPLARVMAVERDKWMEKYHALRAAVEKVRDELRRATDGADMDPDEYTHGLVDCNVTRAHADALDAALRGDA